MLRSCGMGAALFASILAADSRAQGTFGKEATVPKKDKLPQDFRISNVGGTAFSFYDGDPDKTDAPMVTAMAGGGEIWFGDWYITARNILIWSDGKDSQLPSIAKPQFPYPPNDPVALGSGLASPAMTNVEGKALLPEFGALATGSGGGKLREIYAEGDVYIESKSGTSRTVFQAERAYFNVLEDRSLIVKGEMRTDDQSTKQLSGKNKDTQNPESMSQIERENRKTIPIVFRAAEIRGIARGLLEADNAQLTTCTFAVPGYHVAIDHAIYEQRATEESGRISGYGDQFVVQQQPLVAVPYLEVRLGAESPFPLQAARIGASSKLGFFIKTRWGNAFEQAGLDFNNWLGIEGKFKGSWFVDINFYSKRGLGLGGGVEYETKVGKEKLYEGKTDFFVINDISGNDSTAKSTKNNKVDNSGFRSRFRTLNRVYLPDAWRLDTELNYVSDKDLISEFFHNEQDLKRDPETYAYLRKLDHDTAVTATLRYRLNDWQTQTEYLPQATYDVISRPIAQFESLGEALGQDDPLTLYWTHRSEVGYVNRLVSQDLKDQFDKQKKKNKKNNQLNGNGNGNGPGGTGTGPASAPAKSPSKAGAHGSKSAPATAKANGNRNGNGNGNGNGANDPVNPTFDQNANTNENFLDTSSEQFLSEGSAFRGDDIERFNMPFDVGPVTVDPYFENRLTYWLGDAEIDGGGGLREGMTVGFNASTQYWKTIPDFESEYFNIFGLRHIIIPSLRYRYTFLSTKNANDLVPYDSVERFDELNVIVPGVRNRYETKRMTRYGRETVTFLDVDIQQPYIFSNARQEDLVKILEKNQGNKKLTSNTKIEDGTGIGDLWIDLRYRPDLAYYLLERSYLRNTIAWNWQKGQLDKYSIEFTTEPGPDFFGRIGYSYAQAGTVSPTLALDGYLLTRASNRDLNSLRFEFGYQMTRHWEVALRQEFKLASSSGGGGTQVILRRSTHDWMFEFDIGTPGYGRGFGVSVVPLVTAQRREHDRFKTALSDGYDLTPVFDLPDYSEDEALPDAEAEDEGAATPKPK